LYKLYCYYSCFISASQAINFQKKKILDGYLARGVVVIIIDADFQAMTALDLKLGSIPRLVFMKWEINGGICCCIVKNIPS